MSTAWRVSAWWREYGYDALRAIARETRWTWGDGTPITPQGIDDAVTHPWRYDVPPEVWANDYSDYIVHDVDRIIALRRSFGLLPL